MLLLQGIETLLHVVSEISFLGSRTLDGAVISKVLIIWSNSLRKAREIPPSMKQFFSNCLALKCITLSGIKLPLEAVRAILQGLACNTHICDVHLDLSNCELRSAGAQVIQDHIIDANTISSLDLSDNGFDSDMVTLVLSIGRSKSIRHVSLGKNFNIKSKALADVLHRIVQLIQDEECPLQSLSVADSRLKSGTNVLINALGSNTCLKKIDISGNAMGDTGAKMLAKALQINTSLGTVIWDRNNTTALGFLDIASALERNYTLRSMPLPMSDVSQAYRNNPEKTEEALQKIQSYLHRNNQMKKFSPEQAFRLQEGIVISSTQQMVDSMCEKVQDHLNVINNGPVKERQEDVTFAEEIIKDAKTLTTLLPALYQVGNNPPLVRTLQGRLESAAEEVSQAVNEEIQTLVQSLMESTSSLCPNVLQEANMKEQLVNRVSGKIFIPKDFARSVIIEQAGLEIVNKLSEVKLSITTALIDNVVDHILKDLTIAQQKLACYVSKPLYETSASDTASTETLGDEAIMNKTKDLLTVLNNNLAPIESATMLRRKTIHSRRIRPTTALKRFPPGIHQTGENAQRKQALAFATSLLSIGGSERGLAATSLETAVREVFLAQLPSPSSGSPPRTKLAHVNEWEPEVQLYSVTFRLGISDLEIERQVEETDSAMMKQGLTVSSQPVNSRPSSTEVAAVNNASANTKTAFTDSLMDLPTEGKKLEHYTRGRPRPNRTKRHPPSKPAVQPVDQEKEENAAINKLDVGLEEFFTKIIQEETRKGQPPKKEEPSISAPTLPKIKKRYPKLSDFFVFKKAKFNKMQKAEKEPDRNQQKGKKNSSVDFVKLHSKSEETQGQVTPREGTAEQAKQENTPRQQPSSRAIKTRSLILLPGKKDAESLLVQFSVYGESTESELKGMDSNGISGENKPHPPLQALKLSALANMAKSCAGSDADREENSEGKLSKEAKNAEPDGEEETKRQEITSGGAQGILLPPPRRKHLQPGNKDQSFNPVPVPRKFVAIEKSLIQDETSSIEKPPKSTPTRKLDNKGEGKEKNEERSPSEDECETHTAELLPPETSKGTEETTAILKENLISVDGQTT